MVFEYYIYYLPLASRAFSRRPLERPLAATDIGVEGAESGVEGGGAPEPFKLAHAGSCADP